MGAESVIRTRFAPSPSGDLHVGGARTALYCWAYAQQHGGKFILRIEDTDQKRSSDAASVGFLGSLKWLGIDWDEGPQHEGCGGGKAGPYYASQRLSIYHEWIGRLIESGKAYRAFETEDELAAARDHASKEKRNYRYDRAALQLDAGTVQSYLDEGRPHVVRFRLPDDLEQVIVRDEVLGTITTSIDELDDFVILKKDGFPTYHFAVVVDDELMGVTHVIRGQEHLNNTTRHVLLQQAMDFRRPVYAHVSVIQNPDGSKMSKRDKDKALRSAVKQRCIDSHPAINADRWQWWTSNKSHQLEPSELANLAEALNVKLPEINVDDFRRAGYLPDVVVNYLALLGWSPGEDREKFDRTWFCDHFSLSRLIKSPAKFDRAKLLAFNHDAIQEMTSEEFATQLRFHAERYHVAFLDHFEDDQFRTFADINHARSKTLDDPFRDGEFFLVDSSELAYEMSKPVRKALINGEPNGIDRLRIARTVFGEMNPWSVANIENTLQSLADAHAEGNLGKFAQPLRVAVTGGPVSPPIAETLFLLGREQTITRIEHCVHSCGRTVTS